MTDWIYYEEAARDMMRDAYHWDADYKHIADKHVRQYAKEHGQNAKTLKVAYENVKYKFDPASEFE